MPEIGTGHISRTILLANGMRNHRVFEESNIVFATRTDNKFCYGKNEIMAAGYTFFDMGSARYNGLEEGQLLKSTRADLIIFDRLETKKQIVSSLRAEGICVVTLDDLGSGQRYANLAIHSLLQNVEECSRVKVGYDYLILPQLTHEPRQIQDNVENVFVCFGGYDNRNLTEEVLQIIPRIASSARYDIVVGTKTRKELSTLSSIVGKIRKGKSIEINLHSQPDNFREILHKADLAIVSGGLTAFEAVQHGVPCIGVPQYVRQVENLARLEKVGALLLFDSRLDLNREAWLDLIKYIVNDCLQGERIVEATHKSIIRSMLNRA